MVTQPRWTSLLMLTMMLVFVRYSSRGCTRDVMCAFTANQHHSCRTVRLNDYLSGRLNRSFCVGICMERVGAMTGQLSGFTTWVKEVASECESTQCVVDREMLAS